MAALVIAVEARARRARHAGARSGPRLRARSHRAARRRGPAGRRAAARAGARRPRRGARACRGISERDPAAEPARVDALENRGHARARISASRASTRARTAGGASCAIIVTSWYASGSCWNTRSLCSVNAWSRSNRSRGHGAGMASIASASAVTGPPQPRRPRGVRRVSATPRSRSAEPRACRSPRTRSASRSSIRSRP